MVYGIVVAVWKGKEKFKEKLKEAEKESGKGERDVEVGLESDVGGSGTLSAMDPAMERSEVVDEKTPLTV